MCIHKLKPSKKFKTKGSEYCVKCKKEFRRIYGQNR
jgi:hypothetical protein